MLCSRMLFNVFFCILLTISNIESNTDANCIQACLYPGNENNRMICKGCAKQVPLTDQLCVRACMTNPNSLCARCQEIPPITGELCIYACDNINSMWAQKICIRCKNVPPPSAKLCEHACLNSSNYYYNYRICSLCKYMTVF